MKILLIGATGTIGRAVLDELSKRHTIVVASRHSGDFQVDILSQDAIRALYKAVGQIDAVVMTIGKVHFGELASMQQDDYLVGIKDKLMGQVNVVTEGLHYVQDNGSFTLTSGILNHDPIRFGASAAMINGAIDGFVKAAAIEMPRGMRINTISPSVILEAMDDYGDYFRGFEPVPAQRVALAYSKSVEGAQTGQIYRVGYHI